MKKMLLALLISGASLTAMEERQFFVDPDGIIPEKKLCPICQNGARRLGGLEKPFSMMFADGQRFDYKAHEACYTHVINPLMDVIEKNYPVGKVTRPMLQKFLWGLYVYAYSSCNTIRSGYPNQKALADIFTAYLSDIL
jgi:hypothetical protein